MSTRTAWLATLLCVGIISLFAASQPVSALYDFKTSKVVELTPKNLKKLVVNSNETWMVEFYAPWCGHCKALTPHYNKAATQLDGIAKLGAVDADQYKEMGSKYGVRGYPTIKIFKGIGTKARRPSDYSGERTTKAIVDYVKSVLPSFVAVLKTDGLQSFFQDEPELPHAILFTDKKQTSAQLKALSARLLGQVSLGEVRGTIKGGKEVAAQYQITKFPSLLVFAPGSAEAKERFDDNLDAKKMASILLALGGADTKATADTEADEEKENTKTPETPHKDAQKKDKGPAEKTFSQPQAHDTSVHDVTDGETFKRDCSQRSDGLMCVLLIGPRELVAGDDVMEVVAKFKFDRFAFAHISTDSDSAAGKASEYASALGVPKGKGASAVIIRPGKQKFAVLGSDLEFSAPALQAFLERAVGGDIQYKKLPKLPVWPAIEKECATSKDVGAEDPGHCEL